MKKTCISIIVLFLWIFSVSSCSRTTTEFKEILPSSSPDINISIEYPLAGEEITSATVTLRWSGSDFDSYNLYFGTDQANLQLKAKEIPDKSYTISDLKNDRIYYWRVYGIKGGHIAGMSPVGMIRVHIWDPAGNVIPIAPVGPNAVNSDTTTFIWHASGNRNQYTLYLGTSPDDMKEIATNLTDERFTYDNLENDTIYYWKVEAIDPSGNTVTSPTTRFQVNFGIRTFTDVSLQMAFTEDVRGCTIDSNGTVWCWGTNKTGGLGIGFASDEIYPPVKPGLPADEKFVKVVSSSDVVSCAISENGELWCWGENSGWEVGAGTGGPFYYPVRIDHPLHKKWVNVAPASNHTCAIDEDGKLWCWGKDKLGNSTVEDSSRPYPTQDNYSWVDIQANKSGVCGLTSDKELLCMGNQYDPDMNQNTGVLGFGETIEVSLIPRAISVPGGGKGWKKFSLGRLVACAIDESDKLYCWGFNLFYSVGNGNVFENYVQYTPAEIGDPDIDWTNVATGILSTCATTADDKVYCWGTGKIDEVTRYINLGTLLNYDAPISAPTPLLSPVPATDWNIFRPGTEGGCSITTEGRLYCWGLNLLGGQPGSFPYYGSSSLLPPTLLQHPYMKKWKDIEVTEDGTYALDNDGDMWWAGIGYQRIDGLGLKYPVNSEYKFPLWGNLYPIKNTTGTRWEKSARPEVLETSNSISKVKNYYHSCAIDTDGRLFCWGNNNSGELGIGVSNTRIVSYPVPVTDLKGFPKEETIQTIPGTRWIDVAVGNLPVDTDYSGFTCAIDSNNDLWCWGANSDGITPYYGFLGFGFNGDATIPIPVKVEDPAVKWKAVEATFFRVCAISTANKLYCWGNLLSPDYPDEVTTLPTLLQDTSDLDFESISMSKFHTCGITTGGELYCWGFNIGYQLGTGKEKVLDDNGDLIFYPPTMVENPLGLKWIQVSVAEGSTCAVDEANNLWCWGKTGDLTEVQDQIGLSDYYFTSYLIPGYFLGKYVSLPYYIDLNGEKVKKVSVGFDRICALTTRDDIYCWGGNSDYLLTGIGVEITIYPRLQTW